MPAQRASSAARTFTPPRGVARVFQVLGTLAQQGRSMTLAELGAALDIPRTSLFAILKGLQQDGYVVFDRDRYVLGPQALALAHTIVQQQVFPQSVMPQLQALGRVSGETVILSTLAEDRRHVVYTAVLEAESSLRFVVKVGTRRPLSASATGHAVLSYLPPEERQRYLDGAPFERFTPRTVTTLAALRQVIAKVRREHCAFTIDGTVLAAVGIAAPYFGKDGAVEGAVNVAGPTERIVDRIDVLKLAVVESAREISQAIGYVGAYPPS